MLIDELLRNRRVIKGSLNDTEKLPLTSVRAGLATESSEISSDIKKKPTLFL